MSSNTEVPIQCPSFNTRDDDMTGIDIFTWQEGLEGRFLLHFLDRKHFIQSMKTELNSETM